MVIWPLLTKLSQPCYSLLLTAKEVPTKNLATLNHLLSYFRYYYHPSPTISSAFTTPSHYAYRVASVRYQSYATSVYAPNWVTDAELYAIFHSPMFV